MGDYVEVERKFDVGPGFELPDLSGVPGTAAVNGPVRYHLVATYFDTPDRRLAVHKMTLRRRTGGADEGWHLKLPIDRDTREEVRAPLSEGPADGTRIPAHLAVRLADVTAGEPLVPVAILVTERTVHTLTSTSGDVLAEVADDTVTGQRTEAAGGGQPMTWREIEVELGSSPPALLDAAAKLLREAGARPSAKASKLARVLG
jgi:inorganic triphosphatase YgiF